MLYTGNTVRKLRVRVRENLNGRLHRVGPMNYGSVDYKKPRAVD